VLQITRFLFSRDLTKECGQMDWAGSPKPVREINS